jgi:hypothetical protein
MVGRRQMFCKMTNRESLEKIRGWSLDHATFAMDDVELGSPGSSSVLSSASGSCDGDAFDILQQAIQRVPCLDTREALAPVASSLNNIDANLLKLMSHFGVAPVQRSRLHLMVTESSASDATSRHSIPCEPYCPCCPSSKLCDDGEERVGVGKTGDGLPDYDKAKKQEAKNARQKVVYFCVAALLLGSPSFPTRPIGRKTKESSCAPVLQAKTWSRIRSSEIKPWCQKTRAKNLLQ